jgi:ketosteroid isomerase-like protein
MDPAYTDKFLATARATVTEQPHDPQTVLHAAYDAIIRGDLDALGDYLAPDVELNISGFPVIDGNWRGRNAVVAAARTNYGKLQDQRPEIEGRISQGDSIAVLIHETGVLKSSGEPYRIRAVQWFTFAAGKIQRIDQIAASLG